MAPTVKWLGMQSPSLTWDAAIDSFDTNNDDLVPSATMTAEVKGRPHVRPGFKEWVSVSFKDAAGKILGSAHIEKDGKGKFNTKIEKKRKGGLGT